MSYFTTPATTPFADELARYCDELAATHNIPLSTIKIFLPTRRSIRTLQESFLQLSNGKPRILPIMQSIGDADLEEASFANQNMIDIPPAINPMQRQLVLARLLKQVWPHDYNYIQALSIASDLGQLIDQIHTEDLDITKLSDIMDVRELSQYWEITTSFLSVLLNEVWPSYLQETGLIDPGLQRKMRIHALSDFYAKNPPDHPVIMAGSTGSIPATRRFIKTIGDTQNGHVVFPALDMVMDDAAWFAVDEGHPQYLLKILMDYCKINRTDVQILSTNHHQTDRLFLMSEMMRPAKTTRQWQSLIDDTKSQQIKNGLNGITLCEGDNDHHEATIIALSMVEIAADPDQTKTAILITPNRYLAMRVQSILKQWNIDIDDSGGTTLTNTPIGQFALSAINAYKNNQIYPIPFLTTLKNTFFGNDIPNARTRVRSIEKKLFRGVRIHGDFNDLINHAPDHQEFITYISDKFQPLSDYQAGHHSLEKMIKAHVEVLENLAITDGATGAERLWRGDQGEALAEFFSELLAFSSSLPDMTLNDYADFIQSVLSQKSYSARYGKHPRLSILGQIESRMVKADRIILSGLNEGIWPPDSGFDAWMSRPMRGHFGLPSLEQKTTLSAHDFACGFCAPEVFITRSKKSDGQPTLPSRWLERLETILLAATIKKELWPHHRGQKYHYWAKAIRHNEITTTLSRPSPCPDINRRPTEFSVTDIEKWMRDPYWIYAKKLLRLRKLDDVDMDVSVADRGTLIHDAIEQFVTINNTDTLSKNALNDLINIGQSVFDKQADNPEIHGLWWPRFTKTAQWFIDVEREWRTGTHKIHSEIKGQITIDINQKPYLFKGKADRIEIRKDGSISIIDYKTGSPPSMGDINMGLASQLPLEALILDQNGFDIAPSNTNYDFSYWVLNGSGAGGYTSIAQGKKGETSAILIEQAHDGLHALLTAFDNSTTPYIASPNAETMIKIDYNDYAHLERITEWMVTGDEGDSS